MEISMASRKERRRHHVVAGGLWVSVGLLLLLAASIAPIGPFAVGAVIGLVALSVWFSLRQLYQPGGQVVLVYHSISEDQSWLPWSDQIAMTPDSFSRQLALLRAKGFEILSTQDFIRRRRQRYDGGKDLAVIHIDDGYLDNWVAAAPILRKQGVPATIFVSLDFIAPGSACRRTIDHFRMGEASANDLEWRGYLNWQEIVSLDSDALIDIQPHGIDHARVPISSDIVVEVKPENWREHAWIQWRKMEGDKSQWWCGESPPALPYGALVPQSAPALSAPAWLGDRRETSDEYIERVRSDLLLCQRVFRERLDKQAEVFCWPENGTSASARAVAVELGFIATTAGTGENRPSEPVSEISRLHAKERVLGFSCVPADLLYFYASIRCFQGYYYWYFVMLPMQAICRIATLVKRMRNAGPRADREANKKKEGAGRSNGNRVARQSRDKAPG